ncbi:MAG: RidA family protein [Bdellovibrionales bacterium]|nr:RidA family protein [Bdellovibrionales bacterium]
MEMLNPKSWKAPRGYNNGVSVEGRQIFVAGQIAWDKDCAIVSQDFSEQVRQVLSNILEVLAVAGAGPEHLVRLTWFVKDKQEYTSNLREIGEVYRSVVGKNFPAMTLVQVADLLEAGAKVEIEATAVLPNGQ